MTKAEMREFLKTATAGIRPYKIQTHTTGRVTEIATVQVQTKRPAKRNTYRGTHTEVRTFKIGMDYLCHMNHDLEPHHLNVPTKADKPKPESRLPAPSAAELAYLAAKSKRDARNAKRRARYAANKQATLGQRLGSTTEGTKQ